MGRTIQRGEAAMTFEEIAIALGYPPGHQGRRNVFMTYKQAMKKIRARPRSIAKLRELVELRNSEVRRYL